MNEDQRFAFNIAMQTHFLKCTDVNFQSQPLRIVVIGTAGPGKSFLINCLVKAIRSVFGYNKSVQVVCPTGSSANIIGGTTLHRFFKIPTYKRCGEIKIPDGSIGASLQDNCAGLRALLVDEHSLIGSTTLGWMDYMCRYGMASQLNQSMTWGVLTIFIFLGDDVQLPPVLDTPVYNNKSTSPADIHGVLVWKDFSTVVKLHNIVRQSSDEHIFRNVLMSVRQNKLSQGQAIWLQQFQWDILKRKYGSELTERMETAGLFVFPTHEEKWSHNKSRLLQANRYFSSCYN